MTKAGIEPRSEGMELASQSPGSQGSRAEPDDGTSFSTWQLKKAAFPARGRVLQSHCWNVNTPPGSHRSYITFHSQVCDSRDVVCAGDSDHSSLLTVYLVCSVGLSQNVECIRYS